MFRLAFFLIIVLNCNELLSQDFKIGQPNIIYILADDLGYSELGCYGQTKIETPNIDNLAKQGIKFTHHYSGSPVCAPARCMLLTGLHSGHAQIRGNDEMAERGDVWSFEAMSEDPNLEGQRPLKAGTQTIGTILQKAGYKTGIIGKWGLGGPLTEGIPNEQGFDFFYGYNCQRQAHTYFPLHLWKNKEKVNLNNKMVPPNTLLEEGADPNNLESYSDYWLTDFSPHLMQKEALQFIRKSKDSPFFLYYANPVPHVPLQAPKKWIEHYVQKFGEEDPYLGDQGYFPQRYPHAAYAAMVSLFDEQVGEIVNLLKELDIYENTLIIFSSDNGPTFNGGTDSPWFDSAQPFKSEKGWGKAHLYEGGIRVPMIASWPEKIESGRETDLLSSHYDVLPTIAEIVEIKPTGKIDGISFLPTLLDDEVQKEHEFLYWEFPASGGQQAVRIGNWKGIRKNIFKNDLHIYLYDLEEDVQEQNDVSEEYPEIVEKIERIFKEEHQPSDIEKFKMGVLDEN